MRMPDATRIFKLSDDGVACDRAGLRVGGVDLLEPDPAKERGFRARPDADLDRELSLRYRMPIDASCKSSSVAGIALALERGDLAIAQIGALLLQFPDPPPLAKALGEEEASELAAQLAASGLLKGDWDESKHPRTGTPPNPGWFAPTQQDPSAVTAGEAKPKTGWPLQRVNLEARGWVVDFAKTLVKIATASARTVAIIDGIWEFLQQFSPQELNFGEDRLTAQIYAALDQARSLEEIRSPPADYRFGYERHHIVEQNSDNLIKERYCEVDLEMFGRDRLDEDSNIVWVPRFKHEMITSEYDSIDADDPQNRIRRMVVNAMDFPGQREAGLAALRAHGVLK